MQASLDAVFSRVPVSIYAGLFLREVTVLRPEWYAGGPIPRHSSAVRQLDYPSEVYPAFAQGNAVLLSRDLAEGCHGPRGRMRGAK